MGLFDDIKSPPALSSLLRPKTKKKLVVDESLDLDSNPSPSFNTPSLRSHTPSSFAGPYSPDKPEYLPKNSSLPHKTDLESSYSTVHIFQESEKTPLKTDPSDSIVSPCNNEQKSHIEIDTCFTHIGIHLGIPVYTLSISGILINTPIFNLHPLPLCGALTISESTPILLGIPKSTPVVFSNHTFLIFIKYLIDYNYLDHNYSSDLTQSNLVHDSAQIKSSIPINTTIKSGLENTIGTQSGIPESTPHISGIPNYTLDKHTQGSRQTNAPSIPINTPNSGVVNLAKSIHLRSNFTLVPKNIFESMEGLGANERIVFLKLYRLSFGFQSNTTNIPVSITMLNNTTNITNRRIIIKILNKLTEKRFIAAQSQVGKKGTLFKVLIPNEKPIFDNSIPVDNNFFDHMIKAINGNAAQLYLYLYFRSYGHNRNFTLDPIGYNDLKNVLGCSRSTIQVNREYLIKENLILPMNGVQQDGTIYLINLFQDLHGERLANLCLLKERILGRFEANGTVIGIPDNTPSISGIPENSKNNGAYTGIPESAQQDKLNNIFKDSHHSGVITGIPETELSNSNIKIKSSSSAADDFYNLLKDQFSKVESQFPIGKATLENLVEEFGFETCKKHLLRLKPRIQTAKSPVGLWRASLMDPENYPELNQKSAEEIEQERRAGEQNHRLLQTMEKQKQLLERNRIEHHWNHLDLDQKTQFIEKSKNHFLKIMEGKLPPEKAVIERAMSLSMEENFADCNESW